MSKEIDFDGIRERAKENGYSLNKQKLLEIHCLAENILDVIEGKETLNEQEQYILEKAIEILDIALSS